MDVGEQYEELLVVGITATSHYGERKMHKPRLRMSATNILIPQNVTCTNSPGVNCTCNPISVCTSHDEQGD